MFKYRKAKLIIITAIENGNWENRRGTEDKKMGEGQNLKRRNVERTIFWNFEIANIKITEYELFDNSVFQNFLEFIQTPKIFNNFSSCEIRIFQMVELNFFISQIVEFYKIFNHRKLDNYYIIS